MSLNDPIDVHLELAKKDLDVGITDDLSAMTMTGILSLIPGAGSAKRVRARCSHRAQ